MELSFKTGFITALIIAAIIGLLIWVLHFSRRLLGRYLLDSAGFKDAAVDDSALLIQLMQRNYCVTRPSSFGGWSLIDRTGRRLLSLV
jgi:hypothetical protein